MNNEEILRQVAEEVKVCKKCALHFSRKNSVPGEGPANAEIMFIGEGPGFYENEQGRPFVGQAGKFLEELLAQVGLTREQVFIANVVKCRPPGNRDPMPEELAACNDYLERQIETINPCVVVTLGRFSMAKFIPTARISEVHGQAVVVKDRMIVSMYHPAAALHQPSLKPVLIADFKNLPAYIELAKRNNHKENVIEQAIPEPPAPEQPSEPPEQLSLF